METMLLPIKYSCKTRKFPKTAFTSTSQNEVNNKIHTASVDQYCDAFPNSD